MAVYAFASEDDFKRAVRAIKLSESSRLDITRKRGRWPVPGNAQSGIVEGRLTNAINPASNSMSGGTTFSFVQYIDSDGGAMPKVLVEDAILEGVNRSTTLAAEGGVYVICAKINDEWRPIWVDSSGICSE